MLFYVILLLSIFTKILLLLFFYLINLFFTKIVFVFSCSEMFRDVPECSGMFRNGFYRRRKPYQCTQCNKAFNQLGHLTTHLGTHTGEKPYQCAQCNKVLNKLHYLIRHLRTHTGEKPYRCTQWKKAFNSSSDLTRHLLTHTGEYTMSQGVQQLLLSDHAPPYSPRWVKAILNITEVRRISRGFYWPYVSTGEKQY